MKCDVVEPQRGRGRSWMDGSTNHLKHKAAVCFLFTTNSQCCCVSFLTMTMVVL